MHLLQVNNLTVAFTKKKYLSKNTTFTAVNQVSFFVKPKETLALIGGSGSGKSTIGLTIAGLQPEYEGEIFFKEKPLSPKIFNQNPQLRKEVQLIFQNFNDSLNPKQTIQKIFVEIIKQYNLCQREEIPTFIKKTLTQVGLQDHILSSYPYQLSGGQKQRINIARTLLLKPSLIICDEITSALDVSIQAQIIHLLKKIQKETNVAFIFITHNIPLINNFSDRVLVLKEGQIVEEGDTETVLFKPQHNYTKCLIQHIPHLT